MTHPSFSKNLPAPVRILIRPMLFTSLGLHGLLLSLPIPSEQKSDPPLKQEPVRVTQLPPAPSPQPSPTVSLFTPSPKVQPSTPLPVKPSPRIQPNTPLVVKPSPRVQQPKPSPVVEENTPSPTPPSPVASPTPTPTPTPSPSPTATPTLTATATPTPSPTPTPTPTPSPSTTVESSEQQLANFPQPDGAQPGCNGIVGCWQATTTNWRTASQDYISKLEAKEYSVEELNDFEEPGRKVFKVSKEGETPQYLNIFSIGGNIVSRIAEKPLTHEEINKELQTDSDASQQLP